MHTPSVGGSDLRVSVEVIPSSKLSGDRFGPSAPQGGRGVWDGVTCSGRQRLGLEMSPREARTEGTGGHQASFSPPVAPLSSW